MYLIPPLLGPSEVRKVSCYVGKKNADGWHIPWPRHGYDSATESWVDLNRNVGKRFESWVNLIWFLRKPLEPWVDLNQYLGTPLESWVDSESIPWKAAWVMTLIDSGLRDAAWAMSWFESICRKDLSQKPKNHTKWEDTLSWKPKERSYQVKWNRTNFESELDYIYILNQGYNWVIVDSNQYSRNIFESWVDLNEIPESRFESWVDLNQFFESHCEP